MLSRLLPFAQRALRGLLRLSESIRHTTRWVLTLKPTAANPKRVKARLVVRDYDFGSTPMEEGIYSPTTSLEALRSVLAVHAARGGTLVSADVSVAFMQANG